MNKNIFFKIGLLLLFLLILISNNIAQHYSTIHWMQGIPQSIYTNPGLYPDARIYIGMPGSSSVNFGFAFSGFRVDDLLKQNDDGSFYFDDESMLSKLKDKNHVGLDYQHEILAFGFRSKRENYYSFNLTERAIISLGYPKDLLFLAIKGNDYFMQSDTKADFSGIGFNATHFRELGIGFSRSWMDDLKVGVRAKVLFGMGGINIEASKYSLYTNPENYEFNLHADLVINSSMPFFDIEINDGDDWISIDEREDFIPEDYLLNMNNLGFAIDIGGVYELNEKFTFGLSVLDLGFISWKTDVSNISINGNFDFNGVSWDLLFDEESDFGEVLLDSISGMFDFEQTNLSYRTMLPTQILLSGTYNISDIHKAGLLARGMFYYGSFYPSITAAYSIQPIKAIGASVSYSIMYGNYSNVGAGLHLNLFPLQIYVVTDNFIPSLRPHTLQATTVQLGLNWVIGYRIKKDPSRPLYSW